MKGSGAADSRGAMHTPDPTDPTAPSAAPLPEALDPAALAALQAQVSLDLDADGRPMAGPHESLDLIVGDWSIFQLKGGHRFSTDDLLTAWLSGQVSPDATRLLDIGAGIGSVGLMALHLRPPTATLRMIEAQAVSHALAKKSIAYNGLGHRIDAVHGDLRALAATPAGQLGYDAITGSPPYIPVGKGVLSPHPQRAACRMELRGDVFDYAAAAARALAPEGSLCLCHAAEDPRPERALSAAGLQLWQRVDVFFRRGRKPTIALFAAGLGPPPAGLSVAPVMEIRDEAGELTPQYLKVRAQMGGPA